MAKEYWRLSRAEIGIQHHIAGAYLFRYAQKPSWREDHRKISNGAQVTGLRCPLNASRNTDFDQGPIEVAIYQSEHWRALTHSISRNLAIELALPWHEGQMPGPAEDEIRNAPIICGNQQAIPRADAFTKSSAGTDVTRKWSNELEQVRIESFAREPPI